MHLEESHKTARKPKRGDNMQKIGNKGFPNPSAWPWPLTNIVSCWAQLIRAKKLEA